MTPTIDKATLHRLSVEHAALALSLTDREHELVALLGRGLTDKEVGNRLGLTTRTIEVYLRNLRERTRMSRLELAVLGYHLLGDQYDEAA